MSMLNVARIAQKEKYFYQEISKVPGEIPGSLGNTYQIGFQKQKKYDDRRRRRFHALNEIKALVAMLDHRFRVLDCMQRVGAEFAVKRNGGGHAYYSGIHVCGSVWLCPICSQRIANHRRHEFMKASAKGYAAMLITFTMQHGKGEKLAGLLDVLNDGIKKLKGGGSWCRFKDKYHVKAHATALEIMFSQVNGWHPHKHMVIYCDVPQDELKADEIKADLLKRYKAILKRSKRYVSAIYGLDVQVADNAVGDYVSKWNIWDEMAKASVKDGKGASLTPFELAQAAAAGQSYAIAAFREYADATYNRRQIVWSGGARELFGLDEMTDKEIAAADDGQDDETIIKLSGSWWRVITANDAVVDILEIAERGGSVAVMEFLNSLSPP